MFQYPPDRGATVRGGGGVTPPKFKNVMILGQILPRVGLYDYAKQLKSSEVKIEKFTNFIAD
jgi:hypothetical protein